MDDLTWSYGTQGSRDGRESCDGITNRSLSAEELAEPHLMAIFELLVKQHPSFTQFRVENDWWGWAQKAPEVRLRYRGIGDVPFRSWLRREFLGASAGARRLSRRR